MSIIKTIRSWFKKHPKIKDDDIILFNGVDTCTGQQIRITIMRRPLNKKEIRELLAQMLLRREAPLRIEHEIGRKFPDDEWHDRNLRLKATLETGSAK